MRIHHSLLILALLGVLALSGCARDHAFAKEGLPLAPRQNWRALPERVATSEGVTGLDAFGEKEYATLTFPAGMSPWVAVELPAERTRPVMLTWCQPERSLKTHAIVETSPDSTDGSDGTWATQSDHDTRWFLEKYELEPGPDRWIRVTLKPQESWPADSAVQMTNVGLFDVDPNGGNDYWVIIGASIQQQSIQNAVFSEMVKERHRGYDPVIFNLAVSGWRSNHLVRALPGFLAEHPHANYVGIHIGGNNVSAFRPYPGGAEELQEDLINILEMIKAAGMHPILSRLSYRAYHPNADKGIGGVPPEENGSGPYVTAIYDPLIRDFCPDFFNRATGMGVVDAYNWFKAHPNELLNDGIHCKPAGELSWNRLWAEEAGDVVYGK